MGVREADDGSVERGPCRGFTLIEVLIASLCAVGLLHLTVTAQLRVSEVVRGQLEEIEKTGNRRVARAILRGETEWTAFGHDWLWSGPDSIRLRAVRGVGEACAGANEFRFRGARQPNPAKDSVLVLDPSGRWRTSRLVRTEPRGGCAAWLLDPVVPNGVVALLFEPGSYHPVDDALRYRVGRGGRQPVTGPVGEAPRLRRGAGSVTLDGGAGSRRP